MGLDTGPKTIADLQAGLKGCKTVIWNGPMGVFEFDAFAKGTKGIAESLATLTGEGCITIIGGGDSVAAVEQAGLGSQMSHISTGGELARGRLQQETVYNNFNNAYYLGRGSHLSTRE